MGEIINQGFAFIWLPDELPFFVPKDASQKTADSLRVHKASRVEGNVPIFSEEVQFAMPAQKKLMHDSARSSKKSKDITFNAGSRDIFFDPGVPSPSAAGSRDPDPTVEVEEPKDSAEDPDQIMPPPPLPPPAKPPGDGALADSERESSEDDGLTKHRELIKEAQSLEHRLSHFPKNPACPTCQRSRMYRKRVTAKRADPLADRGMLPEVTQFGERIATDFIIVRKLKDGKENAIQVVRGEYSGWVRAYRIAKRDTDTVSRNLLLFLGPAYDRTTVMRKSDQAIEILAACKRLGFIHEDTLENRFPHNSQLERDIRTIKEIARATHLGAGFGVVPDLWPISVDYAATMLSAQHIAAGKEQTRHCLAVGTEFTGRKLLLGQLVHYRVDPTLRDKIAPSTILATPVLLAERQFLLSLPTTLYSSFLFLRYVDNRLLLGPTATLQSQQLKAFYDPHFYDGILLETVSDHQWLGFTTDAKARTATFNLPEKPWQIRSPASAGSWKLAASGYFSRASLIRQYAWAP